MVKIGKKKDPELKMGRYPNDPHKPRVVLQPLGAITPPASADWSKNIPAANWGMLGNDQVGDCVAAGAYHAQQLFEYDAQNVATGFTTANALTMYSAISGYTPSNPNSDVGATLQSGLQYWQQTGLQGYKLDAFAQIDGTNLALLQNCIALFGVVYAGLNVPASAMSQFNAGQPWTYVARSRIEGGHCVPLTAYDATGYTCVTWAKTQKMSADFHNRFFDEWWVPVDGDWMAKSGKTPSGLDTATANADFQALTGSTASPFPVVTPTPTPTPVPTPTPTPATADTTFAAAARAWLTAKGL